MIHSADHVCDLHVDIVDDHNEVVGRSAFASHDHQIVDLKYLSSEQHVPVEELKLSLVDVKCFDERGRHYVVEMQVLNVEGFEKRVVYNTSKAYVTQLRTGEATPASTTWWG